MGAGLRLGEDGLSSRGRSLKWIETGAEVLVEVLDRAELIELSFEAISKLRSASWCVLFPCGGGWHRRTP